jgi:hypothetical protein
MNKAAGGKRDGSNGKGFGGWTQSLRYAFATGNGGVCILGIIALALIRALPTADIKEVLLALIRAPWFAILGWVLFIASIFVANWIFGLKEKIHSAEIDRMAEAKKQAQQPHYKSELFSSEQK